LADKVWVARWHQQTAEWKDSIEQNNKMIIYINEKLKELQDAGAIK
jgi:hypothetical protein